MGVEDSFEATSERCSVMLSTLKISQDIIQVLKIKKTICVRVLLRSITNSLNVVFLEFDLKRW